MKLETTLKQLNALFARLGTWQRVASALGYNRATINKWFAGTRKPTAETRGNVDELHRMYCRRQQ